MRESRKPNSKLIAIIVSIALLCAMLPLTVLGTDEAANGYDYADVLGVELGKNLYDHNFSELTEVPSVWEVASGSAAMGSLEQGGIKKVGYMISGRNGNKNAVRIPIPTDNYVVKLTMYQDSAYSGGTIGRIYLHEQGIVNGEEAYFNTAEAQIGGFGRTQWNPPANGIRIAHYNSDGIESSSYTRVEDIGGGFGSDGNSALTLFFYSYNGTNYFVTETGTLLATVRDAKGADENYFAIAGDYMQILLSDFEVYELKDDNDESFPYENLVLNGSFDTDTSHWIPKTSDTVLTHNSEGYATAQKAGSLCALYSNVFEVRENYDLVFEYDYKAGTDYTKDEMTVFLFLYTAESLEGKNLETLGANGKYPSGYGGSSTTEIPKTYWQNGKIEYTVPAGYSYGQVRFAFRGRVANGDSFSVDDVKVYRLTDIFDRINDAIEAENLETFKSLIKEKSASIKHELFKVDAELMSALKALKTEKGEDLTVKDIYSVAMNNVTDIGNRLELFVDDALIDQNGTTAEFNVMSPKFEGQVMNLSGGFVCDDVQNAVYTGAFDPTRITEDTRPWESLGSVFGNVVELDGKFYHYYRGVDDEVLEADCYTGEGENPFGNYLNVCVAISDDGINWTRPELNLYDFMYEGENLPNNIVIGNIKENYSGHLSSFNAFIDKGPNANPEKPFKALMCIPKEKRWWGWYVYALESADGIHWETMNGGEPVINTASTGIMDSNNVVFWSDVSKQYELYFRKWQDNSDYGEQRGIAVISSKDFLNWSDIETAPMLDYYSDKTNQELLKRNEGLDGSHPDEYQYYTNEIGVYDRAPHYYIGMPTRYLGVNYEVAPYLAASRDGVNFKLWDDKLIENSAELDRDGNRSNYSRGGFFRTSETEYSFLATRGFKDSGCIIDRFSFRVDGFVSAVGDAEGKTVVTTPITFDGNRLLINYKANGGTVRAQLTDLEGNVLEGFSYDDCIALTGDSIEQEICFSGDLSKINQPVKVCFELTNAELYSYRFAEEVFDAGDVNKDGKIDVCDLVALNNMITDGTAEATPVNDLNGDGKADKLDLAEIRKLIIS